MFKPVNPRIYLEIIYQGMKIYNRRYWTTAQATPQQLFAMQF